MRKKNQFAVLLFAAMSLFALSCQKEIKPPPDSEEILSGKNGHGHSKQTKTYSSEVALKWMDMHLRLYRTNATPIGGLPPQRYYGYSAIALYESVLPGMPAYKSLSRQLANMPDMPETQRGRTYHWAASGNAAMAAMIRNFLPNTSVANKASIDSLENALNAAYQNECNNEVFQRSVDFGKAVALLVFNWSTTDGAANANAPYTPPVGPGLWAPTPPAFAPAFGPYWGNNRLLVTGSLNGSAPQAPPTYSTNPSSDYYKMVKEVYDISQVLTPEQTAIGLYYRDNPGYGGGHYLSIFKQVLVQEQPRLDFTAMAFAKLSIALIDAGIGCWKVKYQYNQERPIKYIREVLGYPSWNALFGTPGFPDFPSGHSTLAGTFEEVLSDLFGDHYQFTNHSYDFLGMAPRSFSSFRGLTQEISNSRVYAGIHYTISCERGAQMGRKIARNIDRRVEFLKDRDHHGNKGNDHH